MPKRLLEESEIASRYPQLDFKKRRAVLRDTLEKFDKNGYSYRNKAFANHQRWQEQNKEPSKAPKRIKVIAGDWGTVTQRLSQESGQIYAVLNMANAFSPGGGYLEGMPAQEENIYRRSDCHFYVYDHQMNSDGKYKQYMTDLINGEQGEVYLDKDHPRVCIKGQENKKASGYEDLGEDNYFLFYELKAAADDLRDGSNFDEARARKKIKAQLDTLIKNGVRNVVLSAFGCGAFLNPPEQIARIYKEELEQKRDQFDSVVFAVYHPGYGPDNYTPFANALDGLALTQSLYEADQARLGAFLSELSDNVNSPVWDTRGYRFPFFDFRKTPGGIVEIREILRQTLDPASKITALRAVAQQRLDSPPQFTDRDDNVKLLYEDIVQIKIAEVGNNIAQANEQTAQL